MVGHDAIKDWYRYLIKERLADATFVLTGKTGGGTFRQFTWLARRRIFGCRGGKRHARHSAEQDPIPLHALRNAWIGRSPRLASPTLLWLLIPTPKTPEPGELGSTLRASEKRT